MRTASPGAIYAGRRVDMDAVKTTLATVTNPEREQGSVHDVLRGALDVEARDINEAMKLAAAAAIADLVGPDELNTEYIVPGMFDRRVAAAVARATREAAWASGVARKAPPAEADQSLLPSAG